MLLGFLKKFGRFVKQTPLKIAIGQSPVYFIVLVLTSCNYFYVTNWTSTLCSVDVSVSVNTSINGP